MDKEEAIVFPALRAGAGLEARGPIQVMRDDHMGHGEMLERLMQLTNNGTPPPGACNTWRALYVGVAHACGRPDGPHSFGEQPVAPPFEKPTACGPTCGCA